MPFDMTYDDKEALVRVLAAWERVGTPKGGAYFDGLVTQANFSDPIKDKASGLFAGDRIYNARRLVEFVLSIGTNPQDKNVALGSLILPLLPSAGVEDATLFASLMVRYRLVKSQALLDDLRVRYQIPEPLRAPAHPARAGAAPLVMGPEVPWAGETTQLELQGWFTPDPTWLDVALLMSAAERARSVCRVEVGTATRGTGVLIGPGLVLTNYHVMGLTLEAPPETLAANAPHTILRFGAFSGKGPGAAGQEVRLDPQRPIAKSSADHDFALLRTDESLEAAVEVKPFSALGATPATAAPLYVLQHPEGGPMRLALNTTGVSWVDPALNRVQYTTKVARGSSGSPCFDSDWNLVALHHAGNGFKGEGILMARIFDDIRAVLDAAS